MIKTVLTGVKPTGTVHFGNYVGAIRPAIELGHKINADGGRHIMFVADYHAINAIKDPILLNRLTREIACTYLACGLNPEQSLFYKQSDVPELFEMTTILMAYTPKGLMNKSHAYKAQVDKNLAKGEPNDAGINMGLYTYPVLMAADILSYDTDIVPVGKDQIQHVEIAADIAGAINAHYQQTVLKIPTYTVQENAQILPGIDGQKMSKSYHNVIPLFGEDSQLKKVVMSIKTDCQGLNDKKNPEDILLYHIVRGIAKPAVIETVKKGLEEGGMGYGDIKKILLSVLHEEIDEKREKYLYYMNHFDEVQDMLHNGAQRARALARPILERVKDVIFNR
ncbi:MAG: tryptophan--tRNA ligase [Alphaproteobacteria bacterium]